MNEQKSKHESIRMLKHVLKELESRVGALAFTKYTPHHPHPVVSGTMLQKVRVTETWIFRFRSFYKGVNSLSFCGRYSSGCFQELTSETNYLKRAGHVPLHVDRWG